MRIALCYVFPDLLQATYVPHARRFAATYMEHPPGGHDHELHVLVTLGDGSLVSKYQGLFDPLPCRFHMHDNLGKDIGAYQMAADTIPCDLLVCLGAPVHFHRAGWLDHLVEHYERNGPGLYGCWAFHQPATHVRTTAFWLPPQLLKSYPYSINNDSRYEFEHGTKSITLHTMGMGMECCMVAWSGCYPPRHWHSISREDSLMLDQFTT